jgi:hypothetical protein
VSSENGTRDGDLAVEDVMVENLRLVASTLEAADVPYFLVPSESKHRYRVGIPATFRAKALKAVMDLSDGTVRLYFDSDRGARELVPPASLALGARRKPMQAPVWRVYRAAVDDNIELARAHGCEIEFWPVHRGVAQRLWSRRWKRKGHGIPRGSATTEQTTIGDRDYPISKIFVAGPYFDEVTFPVDIVYTWVSGDDPEWVRQKNTAVDRLDPGTHTGDAHVAARYEDHDELRYSLRSVATFASFVRRVFIVTDGQIPEWLNTDHSMITVVDHKEIFPSEDYLPTFNSHAIEARLHHIPGLAEHYLYLNDDFFFFRRLRPEDFFLSSGLTMFYLLGVQFFGMEKWFNINTVSAGIFGIPAGFLVIWIVSLMTQKPSQEIQDLVEDIRYPHIRSA